MEKVLEGILVVVLIFAFAAVLFGLPLMLLWNWLMPQIFYLDEITFWQAVGLNFLSSLLFKSHNTKK